MSVGCSDHYLNQATSFEMYVISYNKCRLFTTSELTKYGNISNILFIIGFVRDQQEYSINTGL
jgi:hypothetical protein